MKCICVSQEQQLEPLVPHIQILEEVTVINETTCCGNEYWQFAEYEYAMIDGQKYRLWYDKRDFATLPEATAEEMQEEQRESIINLENAIV